MEKFPLIPVFTVLVFVLIGIISISLVLGTQHAFAFTITQIIDSTGDGTHPLSSPIGIATDTSGNLFVPSFSPSSVFKITPSGAITQIIGSTGDGTHALIGAQGIATDSSGNVFVTGHGSSNVFKITPSGVITQIIDSTGDGTHPLSSPFYTATDSSGNVFVTGGATNNAFKITPSGTITQIIDSTGDGIHVLDNAISIATDSSGNVFVGGTLSNNVFKIAIGTPTLQVTIDIKPGSFPNAINPNSTGVIPVAILGSASFDASTVDPTTVKFGPKNAIAVKSSLQDINGDGFLDMVMKFKTEDSGISCGQTSATLHGKTMLGTSIEGSDSIKTVPCK